MLRISWRAFCSTVPVVLVLAAAAGASSAGEPGMVRTEFVFEAAPFAQCHASTIEQAADGKLVAAWFGGTREKHPDVGIWVARQADDGWTPPVEVANGIQYRQPDGTVHRHPCWNPVLFQPASGPLMLFYKCGPTPQTWWGLLTTSDDGGRTWQEPRRLPEGILGPVKNKPVQLADGSILCPSSTESEERPSRWAVHFERTADLGRTWERIGPVNDGLEIQAIQPSILVTGKKSLLAIGRSRQNRIFEVGSTDGGRT
ncbi:MAG: exo-alpha-sialidase, partial [Planctomycetaceae bacterium]|nr:exo-alpha-sialidase [Planctomycetaceae bacterium]